MFWYDEDGWYNTINHKIFYVFQEVLEELGIYILLFDRAGYGESDPNPKRSLKSEASDIEELADQLQLGAKFYVISVSVGAYPTWGCLKRIPHRQNMEISY